MSATRKYTFANSANLSPYTRRRLITTGRPRRTCSEVELIFSESTNLAAPLRTRGIGRREDSFLVEISCGEVMIFTTSDILHSIRCDCSRWAYEVTDDQHIHHR